MLQTHRRNYIWLFGLLILVMGLTGCQMSSGTTEPEIPTSLDQSLLGIYYASNSYDNYLEIKEGTFLYHPDKMHQSEGNFLIKEAQQIEITDYEQSKLLVTFNTGQNLSIQMGDQYITYYFSPSKAVIELEDSTLFVPTGILKVDGIDIPSESGNSINLTTETIIDKDHQMFRLQQYLNNGRVHFIRVNDSYITYQNSSGLLTTEKPTNLQFSKGVLTWEWFSENNPFYGYAVYANGLYLGSTYENKFVVEEGMNNNIGLSSGSVQEFAIVAQGNELFADSEPTTLTTLFEKPVFQITFHHNDGSNQTTTTDTINGKIPEYMPEKVNMEVNAWYLSYDFGQTLSYVWDADEKVTRDLDLFAEWVTKQPQVQGRTILKAPALMVNYQELIWNNIDGARAYRVIVKNPQNEVLSNEETTSTYVQLYFYLSDNSYITVSVTALGDESLNTINSTTTSRTVSANAEQVSVAFDYNINTNIISWPMEVNEGIESTEIVDETHGNQNIAYLRRNLPVGDYKLILGGGSSYAFSNKTLNIPEIKSLAIQDGYLKVEWFSVKGANLYDVTLNGETISTSQLTFETSIQSEQLLDLRIFARDTTATYFKSYPYINRLFYSDQCLFKILGDQTLELIKYYGGDVELELENTYGDYRLTAIGSAFQANMVTKRLVIPNDVEVFKTQAFYGSVIEEIILSQTDSKLTLIEANAFAYSKIPFLFLPDNLLTFNEFYQDNCGTTFYFGHESGKNNSVAIQYDNLLLSQINNYQDQFDYIIRDNTAIITYFANLQHISIPSTLDGFQTSASPELVINRDQLAFVTLPSHLVEEFIYNCDVIIFTDDTSILEQYYSTDRIFLSSSGFLSTADGFEYRLIDQKAIISKVPNIPYVIIPEMVNGYPVFSLEPYVFFRQSNIQAVFFPKTLTISKPFVSGDSTSFVAYTDSTVHLDHFPAPLYKGIDSSLVFIYQDNVQYYVSDGIAYITHVLANEGDIFLTELSYEQVVLCSNAYFHLTFSNMLVIPSNIYQIDFNAFDQSKMNSIYLPDTLQVLNDYYYKIRVYTRYPNQDVGQMIDSSSLLRNLQADQILNHGDFEFIIKQNEVWITNVLNPTNVIVIPATIDGYTVTRLLTGSLRSFNQYYIYTYNTMTHLESYFSHYAEATVYSQFISRPSTYWTSSKITYRMNQSLSQFETMIDNLLD